jgi:hypothetical protein
MFDRDTVIRAPHSKDDARVSVTMKEHGCDLTLFFDDLSGEGPVRELRLAPDTHELEPNVLRQFFPRSALYVKYARLAVTFKVDDAVTLARELREFGGPRVGLSADFYRMIAHHYNALVAEGEPHPVKAISGTHHVSVSGASRWIKEARRRGLIKEADDGE